MSYNEPVMTDVGIQKSPDPFDPLKRVLTPLILCIPYNG